MIETPKGTDVTFGTRKAPYVAPALVELGLLRDLTQGSGGSNGDGATKDMA